MKKQDLDRWYRVTMDTGPFSVGANEYDLMRDVQDCCRRGVDFTVTWHDTSDEARDSSRRQELLDSVEVDIPKRSQSEVDAILRGREGQ